MWYLYLNKQYIVQYKTLVKDDLSGPLEEVVNLPELWPVPPEIRVNEFNLCDQVDAFDNDGWWIGMVTVKIGRKYAVYFENFGVECVCHVKDLRVHQDWIDGKWVSSKETEINCDLSNDCSSVPNPTAKPRKVVGPGLAYDFGSKEKHDPRPQRRNDVDPPPQIMPSAYCYDRSGVVKQERPVETERRGYMNSHVKSMAPYGMAAKFALDIAINIDNNPFYMMRAGVTKPNRVEGLITIDTNLLQAKSQYGGIGVAAAAATTVATHTKVGTVQYDMSRMY
ncbi:hypothetical protein CQW23_32905 [Capsicum baccatum]|uniref:Agenet domain-containing protein n=1 Tax=Capsicum baccatum TaxID=33114 RepID=A0A2G2V3F1_CAPBA|nr:hypothetical protein CQW23_32905 [Capsicum baccatum]